MKKKRQLLTILLCNLFLTLTVAFFSPMEVLLINLKEFYFSFANVWWLQLLLALGVALVLTLIMFVLPPRVGHAAAGLSLGLGVAAYVQALLLNGRMIVLSGEEMSVSSRDKIINLVIWGAIVLAVLLAVILFGRKRWKGTNFAMRFAAVALTVMQTVAFVSTALTSDLSSKEVGHFLTTEKQFTLSDDTNVVEFVLDTADGVYVAEMMEEFPELNEILSGWTWYPNATSMYSRTFPAITYMLSGEKFFFDHDPNEYIEEAYQKSSFLPGLYEAGTDIRLYSWNPEYVGTSADPYVANSTPFFFGKFENMDLPNVERNIMNMGLYKSMPYQFKDNFKYDISDINITSFKGLEEGSELAAFMNGEFVYHGVDQEAGAYSFKDEEFNYAFDRAMTVTDEYKKAYRFYHLLGVHPGYYWDEDLYPADEEEGEMPEQYRALRGSFRNIELCIDQMKALGIYDKATIIVTADHGYSGPGGDGSTLERVVTACPLMMVKPAGSDTSVPLQINHAPVSQDEIFATVEQGLGVKVSGTGSGKALTEIAENEARDRLYYFIASWDYAGPEVCLREYVVNGDAEDIANWKLTGNWWDITHSVNVISPDPFP